MTDLDFFEIYEITSWVERDLDNIQLYLPKNRERKRLGEKAKRLKERVQKRKIALRDALPLEEIDVGRKRALVQRVMETFEDIRGDITSLKDELEEMEGDEIYRSQAAAENADKWSARVVNDISKHLKR